MADDDRSTVSIKDIDMPFLSMVRFMVKWAIASIPALCILMMLVAVLWSVLIGIVASIGLHSNKNALPPPNTTIPIGSSGADEQSTRQDTAEMARVRRLSSSVAVTPVAIADVERGFMTAVEVKYSVENTSGKTIRAFDGEIHFKDVLDQDIETTRIKDTKVLRVGEKRVLTEYEVATALRGKTLDELKTRWIPNTVLFADGEKVERQASSRP